MSPIPTSSSIAGAADGEPARDSVDDLAERCLKALHEPEVLRPELELLARQAGPRAAFALCLFCVELARRGDPWARGELSQHAGMLLTAHRSPAQARSLVGASGALASRWAELGPLVAAFEELPPLDRAIAACYAARADRERLKARMSVLEGQDAGSHDGRRRELALCLFNLELARLGEDAAQEAFAARAGLLLEAYREAKVAAELVGSSLALQALWADLVPYLEEFFDGGAEEVEERVEPAPEEVEASQAALEAAVEESVRPARPPPPPQATPLPGQIPAVPKVAPPPPPRSGAFPSAQTQLFWAYAQKALGVLPDESGMLLGKRAFSTHTKDDRTRLSKLAAEVLRRYPRSSEARAFSCLVRLYLAGQMPAKTLFGKPNPKRHEAVRAALSLLTSDVLAAGHAAVLFEGDGPETLERFGSAIETLHGFLQFCVRNGLHPEQPEAVSRFTAIDGSGRV